MAVFNVRNPANGAYINAATAAGFNVRNQANTGYINKTGTLSGVSVRNQANTGYITFGSGGGTSYSITPTITSVNEGGTVTYNVTTSGFGTGTLYWTNSGSTTGSDFSDGQNNGSVYISSDSGSFTRTLTNDSSTEGPETIVIQLRTGSISGTVVATATTVTVNDTSTGSVAFPSTLTMTRNNLEFYYSDIKTSSADTAWFEWIFTVDSSNFWNLATNDQDHIIVAFDPKGDSSVFGTNGTRDHCGQIVRNGFVLYDEARGFIIRRNGTIAAEHWYNGAGAGFNEYGFSFNPVTNPIFTVRIRAGYRNGTYGERMEMDVFNGTSTSGSLLTGMSPAWGWDYNGQHRVAVGLIAVGFQDPNTTGCIETSAAGSAYGAYVNISNFSFNVYNV